MKIIDCHCDALSKLQMAKNGPRYRLQSVDYKTDDYLESNLTRLKKGNVKVQFFSLFIHPNVPSDLKWHYAVDQLDIFFKDVINPNKEMKHIRNWDDFDQLNDREIGAVLTLEGTDAFGNDLRKLRHLNRLGVMAMGLTWNNANLCADGVKEARKGGLTDFGKEVVLQNNNNKILTDVSHIAEKGFWDIISIAKYPYASHSNAKSLCDHPRNLTDEQIKALFSKNGTIHVVFNPSFIKKNGKNATITDLIKHVDHLCALGGVDKIGFGSNFDGINHYVTNLENAAYYPNLINELLKYYSEDEVKGFTYQNFLNHRPS